MSRYWRYLKFAAFGFGGLLGLGLIWLAVANAQANRKLEEKLAALKAAGEPISMAELARPPIQPEINAATYLNRARDGVNEIEKPMSGDFGRDEADLQNGKGGGTYYWAIKDGLAANPDVVPLLQQAAACPDYDPQFNYQMGPNEFIGSELLPSFMYKRSVIRVLNYQALVNRADGHSELAFDQCLAMLRLSRLFEKDPLLVNYLIVLAVRGVALGTTNLILRAGPLQPEQYETLEAELALGDPAKVFLQVLRTDRAYGIAFFAEFNNYMKLPLGKNDEINYLDLFATMIADGPRLAPSEAAEKIFAQSGRMTKEMVPGVKAILEANTRALAEIRAMRVLNALISSGQSGELPDLKSLKLPDDVLVDPYNGRPLIIRREPAGWLVYSVGKNLKDDGGKIKDHTDVGFGPQVETVLAH